MISHQTEFSMRDCLRTVGGPVLAALALAGLLHTAAWLGALPAPRPTLDADRAILFHQVDAARSSPPVDLILIGDSSCLMDVSAVHLASKLGRSVLNLGTLSYLDLAAYGRLLRELTRRHSPRAVVLLMHPDALQRLESEPHQLTMLNQYLAGQDDRRRHSAQGLFHAVTGVDLAQGRLLAPLVPQPLKGAYGSFYGFTRDLEGFMTRHGGSALDPGSEPFTARPEHRLAATLPASSSAFRSAIPPETRLFVGMTPSPSSVVPKEFAPRRNELLRQWADWLKADVALTNLPAALPDSDFARVTHLRPASITNYTERLAASLQPHFP